jgi:hypothetical protein
MIPRTEFEPHIDVDPEQTGGPTIERILHGIPCVHEYQPGLFLSATWKGAEEALRMERDALDEIDAASVDEEAFADAAFGVEQEMLLDFEFGVSGLVEALCAAGCPTFSSCGGHPGGSGHRSAHPWVVVECDRPRLPILLGAVEAAGCSAELQGSEGIWLRARSVTDAIALGFELVARRDDFDALPPAVDRDALRQAMAEEWGEEEWDQD